MIGRTRRGWGWPLALVGLLVGSAGANVAFMIVAVGDASFAVERDYYRKALAWDTTMAQEAANRTLGWVARASLVGAPGSARVSRLAVRLSDRDGRPLDGARVTGEAFHNARAGRVHDVALVAEGPGAYGATLPDRRPGVWEIRLRVLRGADLFTATLEGELAP